MPLLRHEYNFYYYNYAFNIYFLLYMPLAFCANAVTAVFSSHVVESWHQRRRGKILAKISRKCAIVVKLIAKVLSSTKKAWGDVPGRTIC